MKYLFCVRTSILPVFLIYILLKLQPLVTKIPLAVLISSLFLFSIFAVYKISKTGKSTFLTWAGAAIDILTLFLLAFTWYFALSNPVAEKAYITKTLITPACMFYILLNAFSTNRKLLITIGSFSVIIHISILVFTMIDTSVKFSNSLFDIIHPDTVILHLFIIRTGSLAFFTAAVYYLSLNYTGMIYRAASLENTCTQIEKYFSITDSQKFLPKSTKIFHPELISVNAAVLFADIRDFAVMNETYKHEELFSILSGYYNIINETIFKYHGSIFGLHGDEVMAVFGIPYSSDKDILNAVTAGNEIINRLEHYNETLFRNNFIPVKISLGIDYGQVSARNIGSEDHLEYAVLGNTINTASRITSACKVTGKSFLISETVNENVKDFFACIPSGKIAIKGKKESIELYNIISGLKE